MLFRDKNLEEYFISIEKEIKEIKEILKLLVSNDFKDELIKQLIPQIVEDNKDC